MKPQSPVMCLLGRTWLTRRSHCSQAPTSRCPLWSWIWVSQRPLEQECESPHCWPWSASWTGSLPRRKNRPGEFKTKWCLSWDLIVASHNDTWVSIARHARERTLDQLLQPNLFVLLFVFLQKPWDQGAAAVWMTAVNPCVEEASYLYHVLDPTVRVLLDHGLNPDQGLHLADNM